MDDSSQSDLKIKGTDSHSVTPNRTESPAGLTPAPRSESTDSARPISTTSKEAVSEGATSSTSRRKRKKDVLPPGAHRVNFIVNIALAIPAGLYCIIVSYV